MMFPNDGSRNELYEPKMRPLNHPDEAPATKQADAPVNAAPVNAGH